MTLLEDRTTSLSLAPFACRFVRRKCTHEAMFHDSYLRTNRTNHTKIMRCFPHCCPGHRKRSYCGSSIHIQLDQEMNTPQAVPTLASEDIVVYGRFRPTSVAPLSLGDIVSSEAIEAGLQRVDPSQGEWIEADLSYSSTDPSSGTVSWVFEVNASGRWYYPWSGAATIALRATDHVFEVLVFKRERKNDLKVMATVRSPSFRLMSFRRGVAPPASNEIADDQSSVSSKDGDAKSDESTQAISPKRKRSKQPAKAKSTATKRSRVAPVASPSQAPMKRAPQVESTKNMHPPVAPLTMRAQSVFRAPSPTSSAQSDRHSRHFSQASTHGERTMSSLGVLLQWLHELPSNCAGSRRLQDWERIMMDAAFARLNMAQNHHRSHSSGLVPILSALQMAPSPSAPVVSASPLDLIDASMRMFMHLYLEADCTRVSYEDYQAQMAASASGSQAALSQSCQLWIREVENRASRFIQLHTSVAWSNVMATVETLRHQQSSLDGSADADAFGFRTFVAQCRERSVQRQLREVDTAKRSRHHLTPLPARPVPAFAVDPRVWMCRVEDLSIETDAMGQHSLSLLTMLQFWRHLSCIRIDYQPPTPATHTTYDPRPAQLSLASIFNTSVDDQCYTRLTLDGQYRWFGSLPSGDATTGTTLMGFVVGDYVGRTTSAGTVHVTTYLWPTSGGVDAYAWHWTLDERSLQGNTLVVSVIAERARVQDQRSMPFDTTSIHDKLRCVGRWDHLTQVQFTYYSQ